MSEYFRVLARRSKRWEDYNDIHKLKKSKTLKRFIRKGIPISKRPVVWMSTSGALLLKEASSVTYAEVRSSIQISMITEMIEIDLPRTFPDNIYFTSDSQLPRQLYNILASFAQQNTEVGYCQGLNYIAGLLLLATKSEEVTFWLLKALIENILPKYYVKNMSGLLTDMAVLDELVRIREPAVHRHITRIGMPWAVTTTKWFICIYAEVLPVETVLRIWDCLFNEGSKIIFRVALTLIRMHREEILETTELGEIVDCFKKMTKSSKVVNCHDFMQAIFKLPGKMTNAEIAQLRRKHKNAGAK